MKRRGFSIVELTIVVGIIVLLIAILVPSLGYAKESARRSQCMSNQRQLMVGWIAYVQDHNGTLIPASTGSYWTGNSIGTGTFVTNPVTGTAYPPGWVGGVWPAASGSLSQGNDPYSIASGLMYPYVTGGSIPVLTNINASLPRGIKVYRCPSDINTGNLRTYSINAYLGDYEAPAASTEIYRMAQIKYPATTFTFIDDYDNRGFNINGFQVSPNSPTVGYTLWKDIPASFHMNGDVLSFADGHTEWWHWTDARTSTLILRASGTNPAQVPMNADLTMLESYNGGY